MMNTPLPANVGRVFSYGIPGRRLEEYWDHRVILIADHKRAVIGGAEETEDNQAVVTEVEALIEIATSNLVLDLTLYGQRFDLDVTDEITHLVQRFAPIEELVAEASSGPSVTEAPKKKKARRKSKKG